MGEQEKQGNEMEICDDVEVQIEKCPNGTEQEQKMSDQDDELIVNEKDDVELEKLPTQIEEDGEVRYLAESIIGCEPEKGVDKFKLKWSGCDEKEATLEPLENVASSQVFREFVSKKQLELVANFEDGLTDQIRQKDPNHLKELLLNIYEDPSNLQKLALMDIFSMSAKQDSKLQLHEKDI